jgi:hypothetical protein
MPRRIGCWTSGELLRRALFVALISGLPDPFAKALWWEQEQRLNVGLKLFPSCLAADQALSRRVTVAGDLLVLVAHAGDARAAADAAERLRRIETLRGFDLRVQTIAIEEIPDYRGTPVAGLFFATPEAAGEVLRTVTERLGTLTFSPFPGDVERGVVAGIHVAERILPYVNVARARRAGVQFKPFFLQVAKRYE